MQLLMIYMYSLVFSLTHQRVLACQPSIIIEKNLKHSTSEKLNICADADTFLSILVDRSLRMAKQRLLSSFLGKSGSRKGSSS